MFSIYNKMSMLKKKRLFHLILKNSISNPILRPAIIIDKLRIRNFSSKTKANELGVEIKYERKTQLEHILLRPGMYVGQTTISNNDMWIYDKSTKNMKKSVISYPSGLLKIYDEILVNAADNTHRDKTMSRIDVDVDIIKPKGIKSKSLGTIRISIKNDGKGIPLELHPKENIFTPELIFGHLLTGSNFDDKSTRLTGGSHGYGAKLTNIFSSKFEIELFDYKKEILYKQQWNDNMSKVTSPIITQVKDKSDSNYTKITFEPDLSKFGIISADKSVYDDIEALLYRRALDIAGCLSPTVKVFYNSKVIKCKSFSDYASLFASNSDNKNNKVIYTRINPRWEVALLRNDTDNSFESVSFVNSVWTARGGTHVNAILTQIVDAIDENLKKSGITASTTAIKNCLVLFVNCQIENPSFDGQVKEVLSTKSVDFGSMYKLSNEFLNDIIKKSGIIEKLKFDAALAEKKKLVKSIGKSSKNHLIEVPKLEDAHHAGTNKSLDCTLILTEGDSAKALAVAGLEVVGRDYYGVLPLKGKILNVRQASRTQVSKNAEIISLCKAIGLDYSKTYANGLDNEGLRYGKIMVMCDQDDDGSHIKGLIINFFHYFWPKLLASEGFLQQFITPIVKVKAPASITGIANSSKKKKTTTATNSSSGLLQFYSSPEYDKWRQLQSKSDIDKCVVKYYKGLGTNTAKEGREYFSDLMKHRKLFRSEAGKGVVGVDKNDDIDMAFSKTRAKDRRYWLTNIYQPLDFIDPSKPTVTYQDFINKELIMFSTADNHRSIPSVVDGLKPSQRKVLYGSFKKKLVDECKVVQLAGYIAEQTAYHHGEASLHSTIINMAQNFVGSNNIPLLEGIGQFGTRSQGGDDFASPRYIFTRLAPITRSLFPESDDPLLDYLEEDGQIVEPKYFIPVIPTLLINGSQGIGTGWSTSFPSYNLLDITKAVEMKIRGINNSDSLKLKPWYNGFTGSIAKDGSDFITTGCIKKINKTTIEISELPYGVWTEKYKSTLCSMIESGLVKSFSELHTSSKVKFIIKSTEELVEEMIKLNLTEVFKLNSSISLNNMHAFDKLGFMKKYNSPEEVIEEHYQLRFDCYSKRKKYLENMYAAEELENRNKSLFIASILKGEINLLLSSGTKEQKLVESLKSKNFSSMGEIKRLQNNNKNNNANDNDYSYLLRMSIQSLTEEKLIVLNKEAEESKKKFENIKRLSENDLWLRDIETLSAKYQEYVEKRKLD